MEPKGADSNTVYLTTESNNCLALKYLKIKGYLKWSDYCFYPVNDRR